MFQVDRDKQKHQEKFIGTIEADFKLGLRVIVLVIVSFVPTLFHKVSKYLN